MSDLVRYDISEDELVPVTQEWVDEVQRAITRKHMELGAIKEALARAADIAGLFPADERATERVEPKYQQSAATDDLSDEEWHQVRDAEERDLNWTRSYAAPHFKTIEPFADAWKALENE